MANYRLQPDEVILFEGVVTGSNAKGNMLVTLTARQLIFEREKGLIKKQSELIETICLDNVKFYNEETQIEQKGSTVTIQTIEKNITLTFSGILEARKFTGKIIDAITGTTVAKRGSDRIKSAFKMVDDTLGFDTRGTIKGLVENGVKGTIINGIGKKK